MSIVVTLGPYRPYRSQSMCIVLCLLVKVNVVAQARDDGPSTAADTAEQVRSLVEQMADADPRVRRLAEERLLAIGPKALEALPLPGAGRNEDLRQRIQRVRNELEFAEAKTTTQTSLVSFSQGTRLADAWAQMGRQSGNILCLPDEEAHLDAFRRPLRDAADQVPFWDAVNAITEETTTRIVAVPGTPPALMLVPAEPDGTIPWEARWIVRSGIFRVEFLESRVHAESPAEAVAPSALNISRDAPLHIRVLWEPRSKPMEIKLSNPRIVDASDDGESLRKDEHDASQTVLIPPGTCATEITWQLPLPFPSEGSAWSLEMTLHALIPGREKAFRFTDLTDGKAQRHAAAEVNLESVRRVGDQTEIQVALTFREGGPAFASHRGWIYSNSCALTARDGTNVVQPVGSELVAERDGHYLMAYRFEVDDLSKYELVYQTPTAFFMTTTPLRWNGVPLP